MSNLKMRACWWISAALILGVSGSLFARSRPAENLRAHARTEELAGRFDEALAFAS